MYQKISLFGAELSTYKLFCALACLLIPTVIILRRKRFGLNVRQTLIFCAVVIFAGFVGCNLLFRLENPDLSKLIGKRLSGVSFFGCLLFAPPLTVLLARLFKIPAGSATDLLASGLPPFLGTVRIGCYFGGCCGGIPRLLEDGRIFIPPIQLIECGFDFMIFAVILLLERKHIFDNFRLPVFFVLYAPVRFMLEFYRNTEKAYADFSLAQIYSGVMFLVGAAFLIFAAMCRRKTAS